jgi:hypothetical protein
MGVCYSGSYNGKLLWVHNTHDSSVWPPNGTLYQRAVLAAQGPEAAANSFRLRWTEHAEHGPPAMVPPEPNRASATRLVDFTAHIEQSLLDLVDWVEHGVEPAGAQHTYADGKIALSESARERGGIQPVVAVRADGKERADVAVGQTVTLEVNAQVPPGAGTIVSVEWDFDGSGSFPYRHDVDGTERELVLTTQHSYDRAGTYFVTALVQSHRTGDVAATHYRIPNLAQARIVVS